MEDFVDKINEAQKMEIQGELLEAKLKGSSGHDVVLNQLKKAGLDPSILKRIESDPLFARRLRQRMIADNIHEEAIILEKLRETAKNPAHKHYARAVELYYKIKESIEKIVDDEDKRIQETFTKASDQDLLKMLQKGTSAN
jgi:vacuolar-type H+-ATPase subunit H